MRTEGNLSPNTKTLWRRRCEKPLVVVQHNKVTHEYVRTVRDRIEKLNEVVILSRGLATFSIAS